MRKENSLVFPLKAPAVCAHKDAKVNVTITLRNDVVVIEKDSIIVRAFCAKCKMEHRFVLQKTDILCGPYEQPLVPDSNAPKFLQVKVEASCAYPRIHYRCPHCGRWDDTYNYTEVLCTWCNEMLPEIAAMVDSDDRDHEKEKLNYHLHGTDAI